ncbi:MAG: Amuc_1100 family pilus-like protein, partial [Chthoniobacterales bacterium]
AFFLHEKSVADDQTTRLETTSAELQRLRGSRPFPNDANLRKVKAQTESYRSSLGALEAELKARSLPLVPLQPNEFQTQLRQAVNAVVAEATAKKVQLPGNFYLGFEDYADTLPNSRAAPLLGRELKAVAILIDAIVDARIDALSGLSRTPLPEEKPTSPPTATPARVRERPHTSRAEAPSPVSAQPIEITFGGSPAATRKFLNAVATVKEQLFVIRSLVVKNVQEKGPKRDARTPAAATAPPGGTPRSEAAVSFIVGNEHLKVLARVDIINLNPPAKEVR